MYAERDAAVSSAVAVALILALTTLLAGLMTVSIISGGLDFLVKEAKEVQVSVDISDDNATLTIVSGKDLPMMSAYTIIVTNVSGGVSNGTFIYNTGIIPEPIVKNVTFPMSDGEIDLWVASFVGAYSAYISDTDREKMETSMKTSLTQLSDIGSVNTITQIAVVGHFMDGVSEVVFIGQVKPDMTGN